MNGRIRLLAEQAGYEQDMFGVGHWDMPECQKFAMLIVEECRNVLADVYRGVPLECCGHFLYADEILAKHFYGVEQ
jgi:hypothetical protein